MNRLQARDGTGAQIAAELERAVLEHRLSPGTKLGEDELCEVYGVSRTIVRGALQTLAHRRLVTLKRNRGAFLAQPTAREAREVFEARALLEPSTARSAAERATDRDIATLRAHVEAEHEAMAAGDMGHSLALSGQFHIEIARIADQTTIRDIITELVMRSSLIIALYWLRRAAVCENHAHEALLSAFSDGDGDRAEELMKNHLLDLLSSLDLKRVASAPSSLREVLGR